VDDYILHDESPGKTFRASFFEEKHEKATTHGRVSFSSAASCPDGENTANIPFRGVWGRKLLCGGYLRVR
jgi:hypothetical protein